MPSKQVAQKSNRKQYVYACVNKHNGRVEVVARNRQEARSEKMFMDEVILQFDVTTGKRVR